MTIYLGEIEETLLLPLWGRATIAHDHPSLLDDPKAVELVERLDYDFSTLDNTLRYVTHITHAARAKQIDNKIRAYLAEHPKASIINLGAGLDTAFYRVDNGTLRWYDLDLPRVMTLRSELLPKPERTTYLSDSLFNPGWFADITHNGNGVFILAAGVFMFFEVPRLQTFLSSLADTFPNAEIVFDAQSQFAKLIGDWRLRRVKMQGSKTKWACTDARTIRRWDSRITVVDQFPVFKKIARNPAWNISIKRWMDFVDQYKMRNIMHLRV